MMVSFSFLRFVLVCLCKENAAGNARFRAPPQAKPPFESFLVRFFITFVFIDM